MPKQTLFDDESEEEVAIKTENEYAKKYDAWREKEEIHKLEQKYGSKSLNSDASVSESEDESDESPDVSEEMEEQFLKTLALLKTKDPRIYDPNYKFFEEKEKESIKEEKKPTLTFVDSDNDDDGDADGNIFTIEKKAEVETEDKPSTSGNKVGKDGKIKEYLIGTKEHIDSPIERDLAPLKALWSDPNINEGEAFLRDYILNKKYLEDGELGEAEGRLRDDDELEADEQTVEEQGKFERAYNFRFEEPDHEYLKRFPRTMNYIRPKDERRSRARAELRARKEEEKRRKMADIARLKALKLKEIQEKIARIKEVTGNEELAFKEEDLEGEFDPADHDRRMRAVFDEQYYGREDSEKPVFPDLDDELEIENWDKYDPEREKSKHRDDEEDGPHCEDADFNMDADYDPKQARANLHEQIQQTLGKKRRNRKKKSKLAKLLEEDKPKFVPTDDKTYDQFMEEYYRMDCEDVIGGDLPTRFKYREVVPNDYGLTVEEILLADDRELTQWVPLKKLVKHRPEAVQKSEINTYRMKAADVALKRKVLPSLFKDLPEEPEVVVPQESKKKKKKKKNKRKEAEIDVADDNETNVLDDRDENGKVNDENNEMGNGNDEIETGNDEKPDKTKKIKKKKSELVDSEQHEIGNVSSIGVDSLQNDAEEVITKKKKSKQKQEDSEPVFDIIEQKIESETNFKKKHKNTQHTDMNATNDIKENGVDKKKRKKIKNKEFNVENVQNATPSQGGENIQQNKHKKRKLDNNSSEIPNKKTKNNNQNVKRKKESLNNKDKFKNNKNKLKSKQQSDKSNDNPLSKLSDERLKAYGLNPKKYRSFLKYKKF